MYIFLPTLHRGDITKRIVTAVLTGPNTCSVYIVLRVGTREDRASAPKISRGFKSCFRLSRKCASCWGTGGALWWCCGETATNVSKFDICGYVSIFQYIATLGIDTKYQYLD